MLFHRFTAILIALLLVLPTFAQAESNLLEACVETYDDSIDYFPDKAEITHAEGFTVEYFNHYKVVTVTPWVGAEATITYLLVQCGTPAPDLQADVIIEVPIQSIVSLSTTILPHLDAQRLVDHLVGVDTLLYTSTESVLERADDLAEVGDEFNGLNAEILLELEPDLVMAQQFSEFSTISGLLAEIGLPYVLNADFADTTPLGQAEWGKYIALFFNTEALANTTFAEVETEYNALVTLTSELADEDRPTVIAASPYGDTWYMPAGDSTVAQLIADAGGTFIFADLEGTSVPLDFETVLDQGASADFWVNVNQFWGTKENALAEDPRYAEFAAFQNDTMWNNNLRQNANGGNDYFESGVAYPQLLLADLIAILHPDLLPDHEFTYYQPLASAE